MIIDSISNIGRYENLSDNFRKAVQYLKSIRLVEVAEGNFEIDGRTVYGFTNVVTLKDEKEVMYEAHEKYADIQLIIRKSETIYVSETKKLKEKVSYNDQGDIAFYDDGESSVKLNLFEGDFVILFPQDAHKPCCYCNDNKESFKMVIKVKLEGE